MDPLTNTVARTVTFQKQWINKDGTKAAEDYLGVDLTVGFLLQVREDGAGTWTDAEPFFRDSLGDAEYEKLFGKDETFTRSLTGRINDDSKWTGKLENLPTFLRKNGQEINLSYRVVETSISWEGGSVNIGVTENTDGSWSYVFENSPLFAPGQTSYTLPSGTGTFVIQNQLDTTSITARKIWDGDSDNAYGTRPVTGRTGGYTWEVNLLVQYSTDLTTWTTLAAYDADGTTRHPVILHIYGTNSTDEGTAVLAGLPARTLDGKPITYRIRELKPHTDDLEWWYKPERTVEEAEKDIVDNSQTFHDNYTADYPPADNLSVINRFGEGQVFRATKTWIGPEHTDLNVELQYLKEIDSSGKEIWTGFPSPARVTLMGTPYTGEPKPFYYEESAWTAVWTHVPLVMPDSYRGESGTENTRYRIVETVPSGYQTSDGRTGSIAQEVTNSEPGKNSASFINVKSTSLAVEKKWGTALDVTSIRSVTVQLYAYIEESALQNGAPVLNKSGEGIFLILMNNQNIWQGTFSGLPLYNEQGQKLCYYAVETAINGVPLRTADDGCYLIKIGETDYHFRFSAATTTTGTCKTTLTNIGYTDITGKKIWKDNSNAYETRPDSISLTLWRKAGTTGTPEPVTDPEGKPVQPTWSIPETGNEWTFTYTHLPEANDQGVAYIYEVMETPVALRSGDTYVSVIDDMQLTNTLTGTVNLSVEKIWQDNENAPGLRPDEIQVQLLANGIPDASHVLTLNEGNSWKAILNSLPKYDANGALIRYSFAETELPNGYRVVYDQAVSGTPGADSDLSFRITNVADGDVILTKTVSGSRGDTSKAFTFTFTLDTGMPSTSPADAYPYTIRRQDGTEETGVIRSGETFTLRHNEEIHIEELPGNAAYLFTESDNAGYRVTQSGTSGMILPGGTIHASFENYRSGGGGGGHHDPDPDPKDPPRQPDGELPHTGQDWRTAGLLAAGGVILLGLGLFGRRKPDEPSQSE